MSDTKKAAREAKISQIRALMAKTVDNGCTEAEAKMAAEAVDRLLAKYEIDLDEVTVKEQEIVEQIVVTNRHAVAECAGAIAQFVDCLWWHHCDRDLKYFGFRVDTEIAEYLTLVFKRAIDREFRAFTTMNPDWNDANNKGRAVMKDSFEVGMAVRLGERLGELKSKRDFTRRATGSDLVMIKTPLVQAAFTALDIKFRASRQRTRSIGDGESFNAGRKAAESVSISQGIAGRAAQGARIR